MAHTLLYSSQPATTEIYTLSLHAALPISVHQRRTPDRVVVRLCELPEGRIDQQVRLARHDQVDRVGPPLVHFGHALGRHPPRSEEHTSELQSHSDLVCRLLLEKKKLEGDT